MKIQIMVGKICLRCKDKTLLGVVNKLFIFKSLLTMPRQDGLDGKKWKENHPTTVTKIPKTKGPIYGMNKKKVSFLFSPTKYFHYNCACLEDFSSFKMKERKREKEEKSTCHYCYNLFLFLPCQKYWRF